MTQTFFVTYSTGEYDDYQQHVYTIEGDDKLHVQLKLLYAVEQYLVAAEKEELARSKRPTLSTGHPKWLEKMQEYWEELEEAVIEIDGGVIETFDNCDLKNFDPKMVVTIQTVEEYIQHCRPMG